MQKTHQQKNFHVSAATRKVPATTFSRLGVVSGYESLENWVRFVGPKDCHSNQFQNPQGREHKITSVIFIAQEIKRLADQLKEHQIHGEISGYQRKRIAEYYSVSVTFLSREPEFVQKKLDCLHWYLHYDFINCNVLVASSQTLYVGEGCTAVC
jgi:hypothetical protein